MTARWKLKLHSKLQQAELLRVGKLKRELRGLSADFEKRQFTAVCLKTVIHFSVSNRRLQAVVVNSQTSPAGEFQYFPR